MDVLNATSQIIDLPSTNLENENDKLVSSSSEGFQEIISQLVEDEKIQPENVSEVLPEKPIKNKPASDQDQIQQVLDQVQQIWDNNANFVVNPVMPQIKEQEDIAKEPIFINTSSKDIDQQILETDSKVIEQGNKKNINFIDQSRPSDLLRQLSNKELRNDIRIEDNELLQNIPALQETKLEYQDKNNIMTFLLDAENKEKNSDILLKNDLSKANDNFQVNSESMNFVSEINNKNNPINETPDNIMNMFTQMGDTINQQVANHINKNNVSDYQSISYADTLKKVPQTDYQLKIELLPESLDSEMKKTYNANIKIYPPELGEVTAKLKINGGTAELIILAENHMVKQIVESNLTQLRDNFQNSNIHLTSIDVQTDLSGSKEQGGYQQKTAEQRAKEGSSESLSHPAPEEVSNNRSVHSIIDTYA